MGTAIQYGLFAVNDNEALVCTLRAARNMAFQDISTSFGQIKQLCEIEGSKLVGTKVAAPFSLTPEVYVLPMDNVLATKVVVSLIDECKSTDFKTQGDRCSHFGSF